MPPYNLPVCMALTTRKGYAASVRRQSRQRLRSERHYRRKWCTPFFDTRCKLPVLRREGHAAPLQWLVQSLHCSEQKSGRGSPGRCGCRSAAHAKQNVPHRPDRAAIKIMDTEHGKPPPVNSSRENWTDDIRSVTILQPQEFPNYF